MGHIVILEVIPTQQHHLHRTNPKGVGFPPLTTQQGHPRQNNLPSRDISGCDCVGCVSEHSKVFRGGLVFFGTVTLHNRSFMTFDQ